MKESALVTKIIKAVKAKYPHAYVRKLSDRFTRGILDILIQTYCSVDWCDGVVGIALFVETKTKNGKLSRLQDVELRAIRANGAEAIISRDVETVLAKLEEMGAVK